MSERLSQSSIHTASCDQQIPLSLPESRSRTCQDETTPKDPRSRTPSTVWQDLCSSESESDPITSRRTKEQKSQKHDLPPVLNQPISMHYHHGKQHPKKYIYWSIPSRCIEHYHQKYHNKINHLFTYPLSLSSSTIQTHKKTTASSHQWDFNNHQHIASDI